MQASVDGAKKVCRLMGRTGLMIIRRCQILLCLFGFLFDKRMFSKFIAKLAELQLLVDEPIFSCRHHLSYRPTLH